MSKIALSPNAGGTATFTIASPNSNTDRTLNLPDAAGTIQVSGNPISGTTGTFTGLVNISASGAGQIQFPATQNPSSNANTLDDYEEGTFTPGITFGGNSAGQVYDNQTARYVKVGKNVLINIFVRMSNIGTSTGSIRVTGLPFTCENVTGFDYYFPSGMRSRFTLTSGSLPFGYLAPAATFIDLFQTSTSSGTPQNLTNSNVANNMEFNLNFWYVSAS